MKNFENNAYFWQKVEALYLSSEVKIEHKKGDIHPQIKNLVYPVRYGRLTDTNRGNGISVYIGTAGHSVTALVVAADILQKELDVKMLVGCTEEETEEVLHFLNQTDFQKTVIMRKGTELPSWGVTDL